MWAVTASVFFIITFIAYCVCTAIKVIRGEDKVKHDTQPKEQPEEFRGEIEREIDDQPKD